MIETEPERFKARPGRESNRGFRRNASESLVEAADLGRFQTVTLVEKDAAQRARCRAKKRL